MSILFFSRLFYPHIGGVERHVLEISKLLVKKGNKVTVVTEQHFPVLRLDEIFEGIRILRIPGLGKGKLKKFKIWKWLWVNIELIRNAEIVHCHDVFFWYLPFRFLFPFKKIFTTFHGYEGFPLKSKNILIHKISESLSNGNICVGEFIKKWYKTNPDIVVYGGVSNVKNTISAKNPHSALFIGRLERQTGILRYMEAFKIIKKKIPDFKFVMIGEGKLGNKITANVELLKPLVNAPKYFNYYNFAFVSGYLSIMEAMMAKRLVFAIYDNPLKRDYLKMTPFSKKIVIANSPYEMASKVFYYLENSKEEEKVIKLAYNWVKQKTWTAMVNNYLKLWK